MERRGFISALIGVVAAAVIPVKRAIATLDDRDRKVVLNLTPFRRGDLISVEGGEAIFLCATIRPKCTLVSFIRPGSKWVCHCRLADATLVAKGNGRLVMVEDAGDQKTLVAAFEAQGGERFRHKIEHDDFWIIPHLGSGK